MFNRDRAGKASSVTLQPAEAVGNSLTCAHAHCKGRVFKNNAALANHKKHKHYDTLVAIPNSAPPKRLRKSYSVRFKADAVALLRMSLLIMCLFCGTQLASAVQGLNCPECGSVCTSKVQHQRTVAEQLGVSPGLLSTWKYKADRFITQENSCPSSHKVHDGRPRPYHEEEEALFMSFVNKRKNVGYPIDHYWFRAEMASILAHTRGPHHNIQLSNGWLSSFTARYNITSQMKTEKKFKSAVERKPKIDQFHTDLAILQRTLPPQDPAWGAFAPSHIWNADHVPLPFIVNFNRSYNMEGQDCWIAQMGASGLDKRQATIHLW